MAGNYAELLTLLAVSKQICGSILICNTLIRVTTELLITLSCVWTLNNHSKCRPVHIRYILLNARCKSQNCNAY